MSVHAGGGLVRAEELCSAGGGVGVSAACGRRTSVRRAEE